MASVNNPALGLVLVIMSLLGVCLGAVYNVGDSVGWNSVGGFDYNNWAASKNFQVGDSIVFSYDPKLHNVRQVDSNAYQACDTSRPIASFATGNDNVVLMNPGTLFFICGVPGHCSNGLKMAINVVGSATQTTPRSESPLPTHQTQQQDCPPTGGWSQSPPTEGWYQSPPAGGWSQSPPGGGWSQFPPGFGLYPFGHQRNGAASYKLTLDVALLSWIAVALIVL